MVEYFAHPPEQPRKGDLRLVRYFTKKKQLIIFKKRPKAYCNQLPVKLSIMQISLFLFFFSGP